MMTRQARVIAIRGTQMEVAVEASTACSACAARGACQGEQGRHLVSLPLSPGLRPGSELTLAIEEQGLLLSALLAYLIPAASLVIGAVGADALGLGNGGALAGAAGGLFSGLLLVRALLAHLGSARLQTLIQPCSAYPIPDQPRQQP